MASPRGKAGAAPQSADVGEIDTASSTTAAAPPQLFETPSLSRVSFLRGDPRFRQLSDHLWYLGSHPIGQLLVELAAEHNIAADIFGQRERLAALDTVTIAAVDARYWPPLPLHEIAA